jgi:acyl carrier protein
VTAAGATPTAADDHGHEPSPVEQRLIRFLEEVTPHSRVAFAPETPVFATELFDSLALMQLVVWVEREIGSPLDAGTLDFSREWATVADISAFIELKRAKKDEGAGAGARPATP